MLQILLNSSSIFLQDFPISAAIMGLSFYFYATILCTNLLTKSIRLSRGVSFHFLQETEVMVNFVYNSSLVRYYLVDTSSLVKGLYNYEISSVENLWICLKLSFWIYLEVKRDLKILISCIITKYESIQDCNQRFLYLFIKLQRLAIMGNVDFTANQQIMKNYNSVLLDFVKETPLFHSEDIKFPLSTKLSKIVDTTGKRVKLAGGNWSGGHMCRHCVDGLQFRSMKEIALHIRHKFKMNVIRLTYSLQLYYDNNVIPPKYLKANPELIGKTSMEIFDITVKTLTDVGLMVILNNHTSSSMWCCSNDDGDGLWWSYQYPEYKFFENCQIFAQRYKDNPLVIGMDLRNELRKAHGLTPTWGTGQPLTDWYRAAKICGQKVLKIAPHWLIFVAGLQYQLDLTKVHEFPLKYSVSNKLVYTGHFYSFSWPIVWAITSYESFKTKFFNSQTFVRGLGHPYFLGQFGNNTRDTGWKYLLRYLKQTDIDWTYWALDGFKCEPENDQTYGVFTNDFMKSRNPELLHDMIEAGPPKIYRGQQQPQSKEENKKNKKDQKQKQKDKKKIQEKGKQVKNDKNDKTIKKQTQKMEKKQIHEQNKNEKHLKKQQQKPKQPIKEQHKIQPLNSDVKKVKTQEIIAKQEYKPIQNIQKQKQVSNQKHLHQKQAEDNVQQQKNEDVPSEQKHENQGEKAEKLRIFDKKYKNQ